MISTGSDVYMTDFDRDVVVHLDAETGEISIAERRVVARIEEMALAILDGQPWGLTFRGEFVRLDRETLAWTAGRQIDMRGCDCTNLVAGPDRLYIGTRTDEVIVIAP